MPDTSMEIPSIHRLVERDGRRDKPIASLAILLGLCVALLALVVVPKPSASAEPVQGIDQQVDGPLFP